MADYSKDHCKLNLQSTNLIVLLLCDHQSPACGDNSYISNAYIYI